MTIEQSDRDANWFPWDDWQTLRLGSRGIPVIVTTPIGRLAVDHAIDGKQNIFIELYSTRGVAQLPSHWIEMPINPRCFLRVLAEESLDEVITHAAQLLQVNTLRTYYNFHTSIEFIEPLLRNHSAEVSELARHMRYREADRKALAQLLSTLKQAIEQLYRRQQKDLTHLRQLLQSDQTKR